MGVKLDRQRILKLKHFAEFIDTNEIPASIQDINEILTEMFDNNDLARSRVKKLTDFNFKILIDFIEMVMKILLFLIEFNK
jgi:hypothetical protein